MFNTSDVQVSVLEHSHFAQIKCPKKLSYLGKDIIKVLEFTLCSIHTEVKDSQMSYLSFERWNKNFIAHLEFPKLFNGYSWIDIKRGEIDQGAWIWLRTNRTKIYKHKEDILGELRRRISEL